MGISALGTGIVPFVFLVTSEDAVSIIAGMAQQRTSFPNQNKWPGQQKVNALQPPAIFLRDGGGVGMGEGRGGAFRAVNKSISTR